MVGQPQGSSLLQARDSHASAHSHSFLHRFRRNIFQIHVYSTSPSDCHCKARTSDDKTQQSDAKSHQLDGTVTTPKSTTPAAESVDEGKAGSHVARVTTIYQTVSIIEIINWRGLTVGVQTELAPPRTVVNTVDSTNTVIKSAPAHSNKVPQPPILTEGARDPGPRRPAASVQPVLNITSTTSPSLAHTLSTTVYTTRSEARGEIPPERPSRAVLPNGSPAYVPSWPANFSSLPTALTKSRAMIESSQFEESATDGLASIYLAPTISSKLDATDIHAKPSPTDGMPSPKSTSGGVGTENNGNDISMSTKQKQVIGSVCGCLAGVAIIGLLLMLYLRYKKRKGIRDELVSQSATATSRSLSKSATNAGLESGAMMERSTASGAIAATLANLTGNRTAQPQPAASGERGFYRVSGRKLPSILVNGGDGYTDPRESAVSGSTDYYRGSQAFEPQPQAGGGRQLVLGAPMRPVSGVPVMRSGPARTPVTENPFEDPDSPTSPTTPTNLTYTPRLQDSPTFPSSRFQEGV